MQTDIKKVLAYSTVSQLGYMVMGLGVGAWTGAIFHLFTHAFFKALLFMGAGSLSATAASTPSRCEDYGGLRQVHAEDLRHLHGRAPPPSWASRRSAASGRRTRSSSVPDNGYELFLVVGSLGAALTCGLHDPGRRQDVLRASTAARRRRRRIEPRRTTPSTRPTATAHP